ncbi:enoyl-CoA hydratase/isomerase family protein [Brevibacterium casei]|uniref:enoyl-CoA hydratase/isomerase family protein n=1 Tax=Brevibacterium casei TaxID=33889 RepID=UPI00241F41E6|nr:enoyl-CoA hydratase/isomerase family protein [Brevibacterium casei]
MVTEIRLATRGPIAEIVLDGPESRNALDAGSLRALAEAVSTVAEAVPDVRVLLIRGEGKVFCSGRDISAVDVETDDAHAFLAEVFTPIVQAIRGLSIPVVAQVQGAALGLGFGLAAAADIIYAAEDAKFGSPFAAIGAVLDSGAHHVFLDRVGYHRTMDLIVTGPAEAYAMEKGFVQRLADERPSFAEVLDAEAHLQETARRTPDYAEGFRAFQERRKPTFG